mmetsp:Transcript_16784/g.33479  ORF Transcript_16784/g.33479 Transcript_16784/m.33479 type:complete len:216 (-) Transcript_16784:47-694(-)
MIKITICKGLAERSTSHTFNPSIHPLTLSLSLSLYLSPPPPTTASGAHRPQMSPLLLLLLLVSVPFGLPFVFPPPPRPSSVSLPSSTDPNPSPLPSSRSAPPAVRDVDTQVSFLQALEEAARREQVVVVKFYAKWCKSCQAFNKKYSRLPSLHPSVSFLSVEYSSLPRLCKSLGVTHLPTVQMYKGRRGRVRHFSCSPKRFNVVEEEIERVKEGG